MAEQGERQRVTVVTGGSRGIGAAICLRLAAEGHDVAVGYRSDAEAAEDVAEGVRALGRAAVVVAVDTSAAADVDRLFATAAARLGPIPCFHETATTKAGALAGGVSDSPPPVGSVGA
nr:SDR family NAD(P)-dependent oxidoreductase [Streptomyces sp. CNS654]